MTKTAPSMAGLDLLETYRSAASAEYDEMMDGTGAIRQHWQSLLRGFEGLSDTECADRAARLERRVRDTGIAYDIFADPAGELGKLLALFSPSED